MDEQNKKSHVILLVALCVIAIVILCVNYLMTRTTPVTENTPPVKESAPVNKVKEVATINFSPAEQSVKVGDKFTVNLYLDTAGQPIYGVDLNSLHFNPKVLQVVDADTKTSGVQVTPGSLMDMTIVNSADNKTGIIKFSQVASPGSTYTGSDTLVTVTFKVMSVGTTDVSLDFTKGSSTDTNVAGAEGDILASVGVASFTVMAVQ